MHRRHLPYQPVDDAVRASLYSGKYKATVLKVEIFVTFTGELVCATGTHMGTMHGSKVYSYCQIDHRVEPWEWVLGDLAYIGNHHVITKHKKPTGRDLSDEQVQYYYYYVVSFRLIAFLNL